MSALARVIDLYRYRRAGLRVSLLARLRIDPGAVLEFEDGASVGAGSVVIAESGANGTGRVKLGVNVVIGDYANIRATQCTIEVGAGTLVGQFVSFIGADHALDESGRPQRRPAKSDGIHIGEGCWIGVGSTILPNTTIGAHSIIGAGAVVTKSFPPGSRLVGVPAKQVHERDREE